MSNASPQAQAAITNAGEADRAIANLNRIMDRLVETVEQETARARAGKLRDVTETRRCQARIGPHYFAETERVRPAQKYSSPNRRANSACIVEFGDIAQLARARPRGLLLDGLHQAIHDPV